MHAGRRVGADRGRCVRRPATRPAGRGSCRRDPTGRRRAATAARRGTRCWRARRAWRSRSSGSCADEVALVVGEAVHRVAGADADVTGVVVDPHDRRRELRARLRVPRRRERRIERRVGGGVISMRVMTLTAILASHAGRSTRRASARRGRSALDVVGEPAVVAVHRQVLRRRPSSPAIWSGVELELGKPADGRRAARPRRSSSASRSGSSATGRPSAAAADVVRVRRALDVPVERGGEPDRHGDAVRHVARASRARGRSSGRCPSRRRRWRGRRAAPPPASPAARRGRSASATAIGRWSTTSRMAWSAGAVDERGAAPAAARPRGRARTRRARWPR